MGTDVHDAGTHRGELKGTITQSWLEEKEMVHRLWEEKAQDGAMQCWLLGEFPLGTWLWLSVADTAEAGLPRLYHDPLASSVSQLQPSLAS